jgi:hypothetical protein
MILLLALTSDNKKDKLSKNARKPFARGEHVKLFPIPKAIYQYNHFMGGVDIHDQKRAHLTSHLRTRRNWLCLFFSMAEFSYNNTVSATTGVSPFFANYYYHPRYDICANNDSELQIPEALIDYSDRLANLEKYLRSEIAYAQAVQAEQADKHRSSPPVFRVGDQVWLNRRHVQTT